MDDLVLIAADGRRTRFDLLAGQFERARRETARYARGPRSAAND
jgi:hypothetical protein